MRRKCDFCDKPMHSSNPRPLCTTHLMRWRRYGRFDTPIKDSQGKPYFSPSHGYFLYRVDGKKKLYHRWLIEQKIGRELRCDEVVHHINGDKIDNRIENLELMSGSNHQKHHFPKGSIFGINASRNQDKQHP